jgi:hypothetical protein
LLRIEEEAPLADRRLKIPKSAFRNWNKRDAEVYRVAFEKEKELTDRALKLAEVGKPKSNWELQAILRRAAFALGFFTGE